eukprot:TRINITY_DN400_c0_g2_i1.p1 TRINITY_DN400_c0_g2~~TRINITY_DN400_c0_g2_i1.p1  ORF type:complete len:237 (+),score=81.50 TRINITY_DN400_c0_g2_i1:182-892(+)
MALSSRSLLSLFIFASLLVSVSFAAECVTPCTTSSSCKTSACDTTQGVCVVSVKDPLPKNCCRRDTDCNDGDACTLDLCDVESNECKRTVVCESPNGVPTQRACLFNSDCDDGNSCTTDVCRNDLCSNTVTTPIEKGCCLNVQDDCPAFPCTTAFCNFLTHRCVYQQRINCDITASPGTSPTPSPSPVAEEDSTDEGDIAGAIAGFVILIALIIIFLLIVAIICIKNLIQKIRGDS